MAPDHDRAGGESVRVADQEAAVAALRERLRPGDVVLVKGPRYRTWEVADWIRESTTEPAGDEVVAR
jgi:UDP-N-acetylmuramoyl-tripeptide--D-alanyl-D-alanine ligase